MNFFDDIEKVASAGDEPHVSVGVGGLLAASAKLLAVNRGMTGTDDRDNLEFKRIMTPDKMLQERIRMDASKMRRKLVRVSARRRNLQGIMPFAFDNDAAGLLVGNPLSSPLEEINPMHLVEQGRRITQMGPGGLGSDNAITADMQSLHGSSFGFIASLEGPECFDDASEVYTAAGWRKWPDVKDADVFACRIDGRLEWHPASRVVRSFYEGSMILAEHETIRMCVTPAHRVINARTGGLRATMHIDPASDIFGKGVKIPIRHLPEAGDDTISHFKLPEIVKTNGNQRNYEAFDVADWAEFLGWWLAEGSIFEGVVGSDTYTSRAVKISQCNRANPAKHARIRALMIRMGLMKASAKGGARTFAVGSKQIHAYFSQWQHGCYDKWIPEECFRFPITAREKLLEALLLGDGRWNKKRISYCTVSWRLACSVERLAIGLGYPAFIREEHDSRPHVKTTNYVVSISRCLSRQLHAGSYRHPNGKDYGIYWSKIDYSGMVYCATVPGGMLLVRGKKGTSGFWSGNSEKAGIDVRLAHGARIGSDGKIYQKFKNSRTGDMHWLSPEDTSTLTVKIPD